MGKSDCAEILSQAPSPSRMVPSIEIPDQSLIDGGCQPAVGGYKMQPNMAGLRPENVVAPLCADLEPHLEWIDRRYLLTGSGFMHA